MPLTKQYLRYVHQSSFGVVGSRKSAAILLETRSRQLRIVAAALEDVVIWNPRRGEKVAVFHGEKHEVSALALGQDESLLAAGYEDGSVKLWNLQTHHCQITFSGHKSAITCLQFDQSGTRLVSGSKDTDVILWDIVNEAGLYRLRGHKGNITDCRFMTSQNVLVTSSKDTLVKLWDLDTQHCFHTLVGHRSEVWSIELVAKETRLVTGSSDNELRVFEIKAPSDETQHTGQKRASEEEDHKSPVTCSLLGSLKRQGRERVVQIKSDPSGSHIGCLTADSTLVVYRILPEAELDKVVRKRTRKAQKRSRKTGGEVVEEVKHTVADELPIVYTSTYRSKVRAFDFLVKVNGDLQLLLGLQNNSLEVHSLTTSTQPVTSDTLFTIAAPGHRTDVRTVGFSSDDTCLVSGSSKMIKIWNRSTQQCVRTMQSGYALCSAFVPGDRHVLIGCKSGDLQLFDIASGSMLEGVKAHSGALWSVGVAPDKRGFVTGGADHNVKFWEFELVSDEVVKSRKRLSLSHVRTLKMSEDVLVVKYTPDQRLLAVALLDCTVKVFFSDTLKFFLSLYGHKLPVLSLDISSDSTLLVTSSADKNIKIWGLDFGDCHKSIFAHDDSIMSVQFVPKTHLVFSGSKDKTIKCWDADTFEHIMTLEGHQGEVWCLSVSNDGDTVVSGSHDFSLRLWVRTQEPLILSEEREMEREAQFEGAVAEGGEPVIPGEGNTEVVMAGRKTFETMKAAERIMEALEVYREERAKMEEYQEDCKEAGKELPRPQPHPMLIATGSPKPERYVLDVVKKIRSSELEESLLVMPFSEVTELLKLLDLWIQSDWEVELSCRCLFFLLRVHHHQIVSNQQLLPIIDSLRLHTLSQVDNLRDLYGFNLAGLQYMQRELVAVGTHVFGDVSEQLKQIRKKRKITVHST